MSDDHVEPTAADIAALIKGEFEGVEAPVSAEHVAALYQVIAAQGDALLAVLRLALEANPGSVSPEARTAASIAMERQIEALSGGLIRLAEAYGKTGGKG